MNQEDVLRTAMRVGLMFELPPTKLLEFAALIAAHEREECAKVCDPEPSLPNESYIVLNNKATMRRMAALIRSRT